MEDKIPTWVLIGAVVLAFSAGILNTTALMGFTHISISHVTGNVSQLAVAIMTHDWVNFKLFAISVGAFWAGSVLSGIIISGDELEFHRRYGYAMYTQFILLCLSLTLYLHDNYFGQMAVAMACGLQNSMVTTYRGTVIRTTHLTGTTSDLGASVGRWLVGGKVEIHKIILHSCLWWGFFAGDLVAVVLYQRFGYWSMLLPIGILLFSAVSYQRMDAWSKQLFKHKK